MSYDGTIRKSCITQSSYIFKYTTDKIMISNVYSKMCPNDDILPSKLFLIIYQSILQESLF